MAQYDGVMHVHSLWSDGELGVEEIGQWAKGARKRAHVCIWFCSFYLSRLPP